MDSEALPFLFLLSTSAPRTNWTGQPVKRSGRDKRQDEQDMRDMELNEIVSPPSRNWEGNTTFFLVNFPG